MKNRWEIHQARDDNQFGVAQLYQSFFRDL